MGGNVENNSIWGSHKLKADPNLDMPFLLKNAPHYYKLCPTLHLLKINIINSISSKL
jgi:hypothetical protein